MNRSIRIEIAESEEELRRLHKQQSDKNLAQRVLFLLLLKTKTLTRLSQAPELLNQHRHTASEWLEKYLDGGISELLNRESPPGRPTAVSPELEKKFAEVLQTTGFSGGYREAHAFAQENGCHLGYHGVRSFLRKRFGTKLKVARPRHIKQAPDAVESFKKKTLQPKSRLPLRANPNTPKSTSISRTKRDLDG